MSMETEDWMQIKTGDTRLVYFREEPKVTGRDIIFRTLLPGVFIYLVSYYVFAYDPSVADFYTKNFRPSCDHHHHHEQSLPEIAPAQEESSPATQHSDPAFVA